MKHELKSCPRCNGGFECKVGDIANCQCTQVTLTLEEIGFMEEMYEECLCMNCIYELRRRYVHLVNKYILADN